MMTEVEKIWENNISQSFCLHRLGSIQREQGSRDVENQVLAAKYQELLERLDRMEVEKRETRLQLVGIQSEKEYLERQILELRDSGIQSKGRLAGLVI